MRMNRRDVVVAFRVVYPKKHRFNKCVLFVRDIHVDSLASCQRTPCCGVFMHRRCYQEMERRVLTCGNCRRVIDDIQPEVVLETDEELEEDDNDEEYQ